MSPAIRPPHHPQREAIATYVLARGIEYTEDEAEAAAQPRIAIDWPADLAPTPKPLDSSPEPSDRLPIADVVVITWTVDEADALAEVLTPGFNRMKWYPYAHNFEQLRDQIRAGAPARNAARLGSYMPTQVGSKSVLCVKSELHMNQDGISSKTNPGTATLPVKELFRQVLEETGCTHLLTIGTAGATHEAFGLGDVVISRAAKFRCAREFRAEAFNGQAYHSEWQIPTQHFGTAERLMRPLGDRLEEPPIGPPTKAYEWSGPVLAGRGNLPQIRLDGRDMPEFHPILTTDYFEYGTSANRLDHDGCAVEMGDAVLGLLADELGTPTRWAAVRNMSDPVINGDLPAKEFRINEQTTWAVAYYTAFGRDTSVCGAIATWAIIAGLDG